jgi:hypothetical protein
MPMPGPCLPRPREALARACRVEHERPANVVVRTISLSFAQFRCRSETSGRKT